MRRLVMVAGLALLGLFMTGATAVAALPRACGGFTFADDDPCCVSGHVTLEGVPVSRAYVYAAHEEAGGEAFDVTDFATKWDAYPTYGFLLDGLELQAEPGDRITLTVSYKDYIRRVDLVVQRGEQWLDIELADVPVRGH